MSRVALPLLAIAVVGVAVVALLTTLDRTSRASSGAAEALADPDPEASSTAGTEPAWRPTGHPLGVTAGVGAVPRRILEEMTAREWQERLAGDVADLDAVGARWYRQHSSHHPGFDQRAVEEDRFTTADRDTLVQGVAGIGAELVIVIGRTNGIASCRQMPRLLPRQYLPSAGDEEQAYRDYVAAVVERYDGDGVADMPGLQRPVRWFQLGNENDLHYRSCQERGRDYATPEQYLQLARVTREAMAMASEDARLLAGMTYGHVTETETGWTETLVGLEDGAILEIVDAVSLHDYSRDPAIQLGQIADLASLIDHRMPIWITETSVPGDPEAAPGWDPERQAQAMVELVLGALATGDVERVFWHSLQDGPPVHDSRQWRNFGTNSLIACVDPVIPVQGPPRCGGFEPKPAARTFTALSGALEGWTAVEALPGAAGWRIRRGDAPAVQVLWQDDAPDGVPIRIEDEEQRGEP